MKISEPSKKHIEVIFTYSSDNIECHRLSNEKTIVSDENTIFSGDFWHISLRLISSFFPNH